MTATEFENRIVSWARQLPDLEALIQIGSRVQAGATVDMWSDWDYHLIVREPAAYYNHRWPSKIAPCWCAHFERTSSGQMKLGAVFDGGIEADFVLLKAWQMKLVYWAMAQPAGRALFPRRLLSGIYDTQRVVGPGWRVIVGAPGWETRLGALKIPWPEVTSAITAQDFDHTAAAFWRHSTWLMKKISRGELRAGARWYVKEMFDHVYILLAEEARLAGRGVGQQIRPGDIPARKAEQWLDAKRLKQTEITIAPDRKIMAKALMQAIDLFEEVSANVARQRGFALTDYSVLAAWLRGELATLDVDR